MSEYLIKRSVERDGLPKKTKNYFTDIGELTFHFKDKLWHKHSYGFVNPKFWYEPITLPEITAGIVVKKDIEILHQTTAKNEWKLLREETLAELNKMRELNESLSETILQQNEEIVELNNRLAEKK